MYVCRDGIPGGGIPLGEGGGCRPPAGTIYIYIYAYVLCIYIYMPCNMVIYMPCNMLLYKYICIHMLQYIVIKSDYALKYMS